MSLSAWMYSAFSCKNSLQRLVLSGKHYAKNELICLTVASIFLQEQFTEARLSGKWCHCCCSFVLYIIHVCVGSLALLPCKLAFCPASWCSIRFCLETEVFNIITMTLNTLGVAECGGGMGRGCGGTRERDGLGGGGVWRERGRAMQDEGQEEGERKRVEEARERRRKPMEGFMEREREWRRKGHEGIFLLAVPITSSQDLKLSLVTAAWNCWAPLTPCLLCTPFQCPASSVFKLLFPPALWWATAGAEVPSAENQEQSNALSLI